MQEKQIIKTILLIACLACGPTIVGCRQQAYTEIYAQKMAAEIRGLEDRIYEYDTEFQLLEQDNVSLKAENLRLRNQLSALDRPPSRSSSTNTGTSPMYMGGLEPNSIEPVSPYPPLAPSSEPKRITPTHETSQPDAPATELSLPDQRSASRTSLRSTQTGTNERTARPSPSQAPASRAPTPAKSKSQLPGGLDVNDLKLDVTPPSTFKKQTSNESSSKTVPRDQLPTAASEDDVAEAQIMVPELGQVQLASAVMPWEPSADVEQHVAEIVFHSTLTRGFDQNDDRRDDGVYLVLQPKSETGAFVAEAARITVLMFDPSRPTEQSRIGAWQFSTKEIEARIQPLGFSQGIHLPLKWQKDVLPRSDRVDVSITYEMEDGRKLVNHREIIISREATAGSVWTPISSK